MIRRYLPPQANPLQATWVPRSKSFGAIPASASSPGDARSTLVTQLRAPSSLRTMTNRQIHVRYGSGRRAAAASGVPIPSPPPDAIGWLRGSHSAACAISIARPRSSASQHCGAGARSTPACSSRFVFARRV
ncbi:hypothetical protein BD309DRAFT_987225 [Dichomitus squalens]|nr:hypothetical protein BD309DRAFT_987225 [Dichomitus squalens]